MDAIDNVSSESIAEGEGLDSGKEDLECECDDGGDVKYVGERCELGVGLSAPLKCGML